METERLHLRPYQKTDREALFAILGDKETMSFYPQPYTRDQIEAIIEKNRKTVAQYGYGLGAVLLKKEKQLIGDCGITIQNIDGKEEYEIGYRIAKKHWGQGYAPEAAQAIKDYGFNTLGLKKLCSHMASGNIASRRVAEKIGMQIEKEYRNPRNRNLLTTVYALYNAPPSTET